MSSPDPDSDLTDSSPVGVPIPADYVLAAGIGTTVLWTRDTTATADGPESSQEPA